MQRWLEAAVRVNVLLRACEVSCSMNFEHYMATVLDLIEGHAQGEGRRLQGAERASRKRFSDR